MKIGSLFSGAGGLDLAVQAVFGGEVVWHAEIDKAASKVLAYRFPGVPNLGDISAVDWADVPAVDVLCGGFPCQDVSAAGKRAGIKDGTRSGLWAVFADAIDALRPQWVVIENVRGLLSATAHRDVESDDAAMGDRAGRPVLRAAGAVLGDLADLGYDAQWATVAAADVGAPHRRERVFIVASATNADDRIHKSKSGAVPGAAEGGQRSSARTGGRSPGGGHRVGGHVAHYGRHEGRPESAGIVGGFDAALGGDEPGVALLPTPNAQDGNGGGRYSSPGHQSTLPGEVRLLPTPRSSDCFGAGEHGDGGMDLRTTVSLLQTPSTADGTGGHLNRSGDRKHEQLLAGQAREMATAWGKYEPAIRRWERIVGPAPAPTEPNKNGNPRLSALFSEWLMGWPAGWVTDPDIGISRNDQLRIVGNGVCPQQAVAALRYLLGVATETHSHTYIHRGRADVTLLPTPVVTDAVGARNSTAWRSNPDHGISIGDTLTDAVWKLAAERREMTLPTGPTQARVTEASEVDE